MKDLTGVPKLVQGSSDNEYIIQFPSGEGFNFFTSYDGVVALKFLFFDLKVIDKDLFRQLKYEIGHLPIPWSVDTSVRLQDYIEKTDESIKQLHGVANHLLDKVFESDSEEPASEEKPASIVSEPLSKRLH